MWWCMALINMYAQNALLMLSVVGRTLHQHVALEKTVKTDENTTRVLTFSAHGFTTQKIKYNTYVK